MLYISESRSLSKERIGIIYERGGKAGKDRQRNEAVSPLRECFLTGYPVLLKEQNMIRTALSNGKCSGQIFLAKIPFCQCIWH